MKDTATWTLAELEARAADLGLPLTDATPLGRYMRRLTLRLAGETDREVRRTANELEREIRERLSESHQPGLNGDQA